MLGYEGSAGAGQHLPGAVDVTARGVGGIQVADDRTRSTTRSDAPSRSTVFPGDSYSRAPPLAPGVLHAAHDWHAADQETTLRSIDLSTTLAKVRH